LTPKNSRRFEERMGERLMGLRRCEEQRRSPRHTCKQRAKHINQPTNNALGAGCTSLRSRRHRQ
jgi:hypothetical protein